MTAPAARFVRPTPEGDRVRGVVCGRCKVASGASQVPSVCFSTRGCRARFDRGEALAILREHGGRLDAEYIGAWTADARASVEVFVVSKTGHA